MNEREKEREKEKKDCVEKCRELQELIGWGPSRKISIQTESTVASRKVMREQRG